MHQIHLSLSLTFYFISADLLYPSWLIKFHVHLVRGAFLSQFTPATPDHDYCAIKYSEIASASAFTLFVNNGGLRIPSQSEHSVVEYAEKEFKASVCKDGHQITREEKLKQKLITNVCKHFIMDCSHQVFQDHEQGLNENVLEEDHQTTLIKLISERYLKLRLFSYGKQYNEAVVKNGKPSDRQRLTKLILFRNE